jgi:hypothetical protein
MKDYVFLTAIGEIVFTATLKEHSEHGWEPIWQTFKRGTNKENKPTYEVILEKIETH